MNINNNRQEERERRMAAMRMITQMMIDNAEEIRKSDPSFIAPKHFDAPASLVLAAKAVKVTKKGDYLIQTPELILEVPANVVSAYFFSSMYMSKADRDAEMYQALRNECVDTKVPIPVHVDPVEGSEARDRRVCEDFVLAFDSVLLNYEWISPFLIVFEADLNESMVKKIIDLLCAMNPRRNVFVHVVSPSIVPNSYDVEVLGKINERVVVHVECVYQKSHILPTLFVQYSYNERLLIRDESFSEYHDDMIAWRYYRYFSFATPLRMATSMDSCNFIEPFSYYFGSTRFDSIRMVESERRMRRYRNNSNGTCGSCARVCYYVNHLFEYRFREAYASTHHCQQRQTYQSIIPIYQSLAQVNNRLVIRGMPMVGYPIYPISSFKHPFRNNIVEVSTVVEAGRLSWIRLVGQWEYECADRDCFVVLQPVTTDFIAKYSDRLLLDPQNESYTDVAYVTMMLPGDDAIVESEIKYVEFSIRVVDISD